MDTANSAFDAAGFGVANKAAATRNEAAGYASADKLARDRAEAVSKAATGAQVTIGDAALRDRQQAVQDASQLYGISNEAMTRLYGLGPGTLSARAAGTSGDQLAMDWLTTAQRLAGGRA